LCFAFFTLKTNPMTLATIAAQLLSILQTTDLDDDQISPVLQALDAMADYSDECQALAAQGHDIIASRTRAEAPARINSAADIDAAQHVLWQTSPHRDGSACAY
jgi:D-serine dehydratase